MDECAAAACGGVFSRSRRPLMRPISVDAVRFRWHGDDAEHFRQELLLPMMRWFMVIGGASLVTLLVVSVLTFGAPAQSTFAGLTLSSALSFTTVVVARELVRAGRVQSGILSVFGVSLLSTAVHSLLMPELLVAIGAVPFVIIFAAMPHLNVRRVATLAVAAAVTLVLCDNFIATPTLAAPAVGARAALSASTLQMCRLSGNVVLSLSFIGVAYQYWTWLGRMLAEARRTNAALEDAKRELTSEIGERVQVERELREQAAANRRLLNRVSHSEATLAARMVEQTRQLTQTQLENEQLRVAAARVAVAAERSRLAGELHDSVAQAIFGIALSARTLQALKDTAGDAMPTARLTPPLEQIVNLSEGALAEIRALMFELRPDSLEAEGLLAALRKQATAIRARHGINLRADLGDEEPNVSLAKKDLIYRTAVVALYCMVKYARASAAALRVGDSADGIELELVDNGPGLTDDAAALRGAELQDMQLHARQAGGVLQLTHNAAGTRVWIWLPKQLSPSTLPAGNSLVPEATWVTA